MSTAARQSPSSRAAESTPPVESLSYAWPGMADGPNARVREERRRIGIVRQVTYVVIDIVLACLGATLAFAVRFGLSSVSGKTFVPLSKVIEYARAHHYPAYLQLYAALIVLACMSMHLYHTSREVSAWYESLRVARAVLLATALLVVFIFISGNKEISREVITSARAIN